MINNCFDSDRSISVLLFMIFLAHKYLLYILMSLYTLCDHFFLEPMSNPTHFLSENETDTNCSYNIDCIINNLYYNVNTKNLV
jgi:hypothetical protein